MVEFDKIERAQFRRPILLHAEDPNEKFPAYVDVDEKFNINDKISMVNTLVQMQNVTSYPFMHKCLRDGRTHIHALWFDVYTGEVHCFSRKEKVFFNLYVYLSYLFVAPFLRRNGWTKYAQMFWGILWVVGSQIRLLDS